MQEEDEAAAVGRQGEERDLGVGTQEPNASPDQGTAGTSYGFEEFGQDLSGAETAQGVDIEMPTETAERGVDADAGDELPPSRAPGSWYEQQDLKNWDHLDTYEELGEHWKDLQDHNQDLVRELDENHKWEALGGTAEDVGEGVTDAVKSIPFVGEGVADGLEDLGDRVEDVVEDNMDAPYVDPEHGPLGAQFGELVEHYDKDFGPYGSMGDEASDYTSKYDLKSMEGLDTYEELEADYKQQLEERDDYIEEKYERHQAEALKGTAEDVGEGVTDAVKNIPFVGEGIADSLEDVVDAMPDPDDVNQGPTEPLDRGNVDLNASGFDVDKPFVDPSPETTGYVTGAYVGEGVVKEAEEGETVDFMDDPDIKAELNQGDRLEEAEGDDPVNPDPVDPDPWAGAAPAGLYQGPTESLGYQPSPAELKASGFDVDKPFVDLHPETTGYMNPATVGYQDDPVVEDVVEEDVVDDSY